MYKNKQFKFGSHEQLDSIPNLLFSGVNLTDRNTYPLKGMPILRLNSKNVSYKDKRNVGKYECSWSKQINEISTPKQESFQEQTRFLQEVSQNLCELYKRRNSPAYHEGLQQEKTKTHWIFELLKRAIADRI